MRFLLLIVPLLIAASAFAEPKRERVAGTQVSLVVPEGFVKTVQFAGYALEEKGASIMVTKTPGGSYEEISRAYTKQAMASQGMSLLSKEGVMIGPEKSQRAMLFNASQWALGNEFLKWLLLFGDDKNVFLVVATFPKVHEKDFSSRLKKTLLSCQWEQKAVVAAGEGLHFSAQDSGKIKFTKRVGQSLIFSKDAIFPIETKSDPIFVVFPMMLGEGYELGDLKTFARQRLKQTGNFEMFSTLIEEGPCKIAGFSGYRMQAKARHLQEGHMIFLEQTVLQTPKGPFIFQGMVDEKEKELYQPHFRKIAESFKLL